MNSRSWLCFSGRLEFAMRSWAHSFSLQFERFWSLQVVLWVTCSPRSLGQKRWRSHPAAGGSWWKKCCSRGILQPGAQKVHLDAMAQLGIRYLCFSFLNSERNFSWQRLSLPLMGSGALFVSGLGHLIKVWQGLAWKPWKPGKDGGWAPFSPSQQEQGFPPYIQLPKVAWGTFKIPWNKEALPSPVPWSCCLSDTDEHSQESWSPQLCQTFRGI